MMERWMPVPFLRGLKKPLRSSNRKSPTNWRARKWLNIAAAVARVAQDRVLAARAGLVVAVQPRDSLGETGPVQQVIHLAAGAVMLLARVKAGA